MKKIFDNLDKSCDKWDPYFEVYNRFILDKYQYDIIPKLKDPKVIVEVGVQKGGSLELWSKVFTGDIQIIGIDIDPECAKLHYEDPRIEIVIGDQGDSKFWDEFLKTHPKIDIFVDDGGHFMDQQILTFEKVFPTMPIGSVYICEDCHTSYMPYNGGGYKNLNSFIEYAKSYIDILHSQWIDFDPEMERRANLVKGLTSIHFYNSIVVFEKFGTKEMKRVQPRKFSTTQ